MVREKEGRSGNRYAIIRGIEFKPLDVSPLGWRTFLTYIVGELATERAIAKLWTFSSGGAVLDKEAIGDLAAESGFTLVDLPVPSPVC